MHFVFIKAGKYETEELKNHLEMDCDQKCRFGCCWWYWVPRMKIRLKTEYKLIEIIWLRFVLSYEGMLN